jgi:hypothetical protein
LHPKNRAFWWVQGPLGEPNRSAFPKIFILRPEKFQFQPYLQRDASRIGLQFGMKMPPFPPLSGLFEPLTDFSCDARQAEILSSIRGCVRMWAGNFFFVPKAPLKWHIPLQAVRRRKTTCGMCDAVKEAPPRRGMKCPPAFHSVGPTFA